MSSSVIAFPKACIPRSRAYLRLPKASLGIGNKWVTTSGQYALLPFTWGRVFRLLAVIEPKTIEGQVVDKDLCHSALEELTIDFTRSCYGEGADQLLQMIAVLEPTAVGGFACTVLFDVPMHASMSQLHSVATTAFEGLIAPHDEELPSITIADGAGPGEIVHLVLRSMAQNDDIS